ncbi:MULTISPECIES: M18 family aminopeptidase [Auritidibacter]|uniref:M18 family aminopeptidase n=1 Tax=Auritidibacter TaxID=1160973 RepID=UPI000D7275D1|nr:MULTISPECIES: M18 family aminopeptidase [Auritidibacter]AXR75169.1 M18 family aminopeptidase [Auritidibacter sp. NML130574]WGH90213.1 M18 family aminopeptidase [Auritidibacter ignavus]
MSHLDELVRLISDAPTSWHAADYVAREAIAAGFTRLEETEPYPLAPGGYVVVRDGAVIAWIQPEATGEDSATLPGFRILGAHTDSPGFKVKPSPDTTTAGWAQVGVEVYGGPLVNSWLDRDLAFAGRLVLRDGSTKLVTTSAMARIPQLAIHLDRETDRGLTLNRQQHLLPIVATASGDSATTIVHAIAEEAGLSADHVVAADLMLADTQPPAILGSAQEFLAAPRMDNLVSVSAGLSALLEVAHQPAPDLIPVLAAFDHEEVGSQTRSGAAGPFLDETLVRIQHSLGISPEESPRVRAKSWLLSADCGHVVHPNYVTKHDPDHHPLPNQGPLVKINANQRYTTDAMGHAAMAGWAEDAGVPIQEFVSRNDVPCGSTIGPIASTRLGIPTVDCGVGLLSMHSVRELVGVKDPGYLTRLTAAFFRQ